MSHRSWEEKVLTDIPLRPGPGIRHICIGHDDACPFLYGNGACNCDTTVKEVTAAQAVRNIAYERLRRGRKAWRRQ